MPTFLITLLFALPVYFGDSPAPKDCEVLLEAIAGQYEGECKKGLAEGTGTSKGSDTYVGEFKKGFPDGQGRYIWSNGNYYSGDFVKGVKDGYGELMVKREGKKDSLVAGYWLNDFFIGSSNVPYRVNKSVNVKNVTFEKITDNGSEIMIVCERNKQPVVADGLRLTNRQGVKPLSEYDYTVLRKIEFPFTEVKMDFRSQAATSSTIVEHTAEFDIFEKGRWLITIELN